MNHTIKVVGTIVAMLMASTAVAQAFEDDALLIWTGAQRDKDQLEKASQAFSEEFGVTVTVEVVDPDLPGKYQQAASTGDGPDIVLWAHDRFGEWAAGGLIEPVSPPTDWTDGVLPTALDAVSFDGRVWGYPVSVEAVHLIYNKDIVATPPASFEEIGGLDMPDGVTAIMWDYNNTYFTMPLMQAGGGYAFKKVDGKYDGKDTGVNNAGSIAGAAMVKKLIDDGIMPKGVDYGIMDGAMNKGEVAMVLNGPWAWGGLDTSGINYGVAPIPTVAGNPSPPFLGVQALAINAASPNKDLAAEFIENYLATDDGLGTWNANNGLGALADISAAEAQNDPRVSGMLEAAAIGIPMPSNPEMGAFWSAMAPALTNITSGEQSPEAALNDAAARILGAE